MLETMRLDFILEAARPIAHAEENFGNSSVLMRKKVRQRDGSWQRVPIVTGDTMRHGLREAAALAYLDAAGLLGESLTEAALRLLFAGGMVTGSAGGSIRLGDYRTMCDLFPPLALLGGCAQNRVIPGRVQVDDATLICAEAAVPDWAREWLGGAPLDSARAHVEDVQRVRMDPTSDPTKCKLLVGSARDLVEQRHELREQASTDEDDAGAAGSKSSIMPRRFERLAEGSLFSWSVTATLTSELDRDTFMVMIGGFLANAVVGGKKATGHGLLKPVAARQVDLLRPADRASVIDATAIGNRVGGLFRAHVADRRDAIAEFLGQVAA